MTDTHDDNDHVVNDKNIFNIDGNVNVDNDNVDSAGKTQRFPLAKEELLATDLAEGLDDKANIRFYFSVCRKYPEELLRKIYSQVKEIPPEKIKKSRGALFNYLLQNYEKHNHRN